LFAFVVLGLVSSVQEIGWEECQPVYSAVQNGQVS